MFKNGYIKYRIINKVYKLQYQVLTPRRLMRSYFMSKVGIKVSKNNEKKGLLCYYQKKGATHNSKKAPFKLIYFWG